MADLPEDIGFPDLSDQKPVILCDYCQRIFLDERYELDRHSDYDSLRFKAWNGLEELHRNIFSVLQGYSENCVICVTVTTNLPLEVRRELKHIDHNDRESVVRVLEKAGHMEAMGHRIETIAVPNLWPKNTALERTRIILSFKAQILAQVHATSWSGTIVLRSLFNDKMRGREFFGDITLAEPTELDATAALSYNQSSASSPETLTLCKSWLDQCQNSHAACREVAPWLPTRLLRLSDDKATLVDSSELQHVPYVTLSHCWGRHAFRTLTLDTMAAFREGVLIQDFMPSFRDAMHVVKMLGLSYLWIDSYCIIQQSADDWEVESQLMELVYTHGTFNIAATEASSPEGGLFFSRPARYPRHATTTWPLFDQTVLMLPHSRVDSVLSKKPKGPLLGRGWVLQERLLSRRMISFDTHGVWWTCRSCNLLSEALPNHLRATHQHYPQEVYPGLLSDSNLLHETWSNVVNEYTRTQLTYADKDKLRALLGVVTRFNGRGRGKIVYGLYQQTLLISLLWFPLTHVTRSESRGFPSWSWLSSDGAIYIYPNRADAQENALCAIASYPADAKLIACVGKLFRARLGQADDLYGFQSTDEDTVDMVCDWECKATAKFDVVGEVVKSTVIYALAMIQPDGPDYFMLLLAQKEDGTFRRVGVCRDPIYPRSFLRDIMKLYRQTTPSLILLS